MQTLSGLTCLEKEVCTTGRVQAASEVCRQVGSDRNKREVAIWIDVKGKEG